MQRFQPCQGAGTARPGGPCPLFPQRRGCGSARDSELLRPALQHAPQRAAEIRPGRVPQLTLTHHNMGTLLIEASPCGETPSTPHCLQIVRIESYHRAMWTQETTRFAARPRQTVSERYSS